MQKNPETSQARLSLAKCITLAPVCGFSTDEGGLFKPATLLQHLSQNLCVMSKVFTEAGRIQVSPVSAI